MTSTYHPASVFADHFLLNVVIFVLGQAAAVGYLRTGLVARGVALMIVGWLFADIALVARLAFEDAYGTFRASLLAMQLYSLVELVLFTSGRIRRRRPAAVAEREQMFRRALTHYVRNEIDPAMQIYRRLLRADPWDLEVTLWLATSLNRTGELRKARSRLRRVAALDRDDRFADVIRDEMRRCSPQAQLR